VTSRTRARVSHIGGIEWRRRCAYTLLMPRSCKAAAARVLWLEDDASAPVVGASLEALDDAMRVIDVAYLALERAALRAPRGSALREAALRLAGARRTWLAIAAEHRLGADSGEDEAFAEVERASQQLRRVIERTDESGDVRGNVVSLVGLKPSTRRGHGRGGH